MPLHHDPLQATADTVRIYYIWLLSLDQAGKVVLALAAVASSAGVASAVP